MKFFILSLIGIALGLAIAWIPFPMNLAVCLMVILCVASAFSPSFVIVSLLGVSTMRILWYEGGIAPEELGYSLTFLSLLLFSFFYQFFRPPHVSYRPVWDFRITFPVFSMGLLGFWGTALGIVQGHLFAHWASDLNFILFFWLFFVVTIRITDIRGLYRILWPTMWITAGVVLWGIGKRLIERGIVTGIAPGFPRASSFSSTFFVLLMCLFLFEETGSLKRKGLFLLACFFGVHQFLSFVRTLWVAQIGTLGFIFLVLPFSARRRLLRWVGGFLVMLSIVFTISWVAPTDNLFVKMPTYLLNRFLSIFTDVTGSGVTMRTRYAEWEAALKTFAQHPLSGNGLGTQIQYIRYDYASLPWTTERYIHSSYIYYLLSTGPLGLALFLWFCWRAVRFGLQVYRRISESALKGLALGMTASVVFQILNSIAGNELNNPSRTIWTGFFLGALAVIDREVKPLKESAG